jgi:hypothetical protein
VISKQRNKLEARVDECIALLNIKYMQWKAEFESELNPFIAVQKYCSPEQRARRQTWIKPWIDAKQTLEVHRGRGRKDITAVKPNAKFSGISRKADERVKTILAPRQSISIEPKGGGIRRMAMSKASI